MSSSHIVEPSSSPTTTSESQVIDPERLAYEAAQGQAHTKSQPTSLQISPRELALGLVAMFVWFGLFSGGILVSTQPYREALQNSELSVTMFRVWFFVFLFWTVTNIGILSCVASFLGALGRRTRFTLRMDVPKADVNSDQKDPHGVATYYTSAIMRGFGIYMLMLAGILVLATEALIAPTQSEYMRLAPTASIISFYAGFDPSIFASLLSRVESFLQPPAAPETN